MRRADNQTAIDGLAEQAEVIQRMHLLTGRFSAEEIERLVKWQIRCRTRPDVLDVPIAMSRLRFARWLFEHGRIGEVVGIHPEALGGEAPCESPAQETTAVSSKYPPPEYWDPQFRRGGSGSSRRERGEPGYRPLLQVLSCVRARLARLSTSLRELEHPRRGTGVGQFDEARSDTGSQADTWRFWSGLF